MYTTNIHSSIDIIIVPLWYQYPYPIIISERYFIVRTSPEITSLWDLEDLNLA